MMPPLYKLHQTVTRNGCIGFFKTKRGEFSEPQIRKIYFFFAGRRENIFWIHEGCHQTWYVVSSTLGIPTKNQPYLLTDESFHLGTYYFELDSFSSIWSSSITITLHPRSTLSLFYLWRQKEGTLFLRTQFIIICDVYEFISLFLLFSYELLLNRIVIIIVE